MKFLVPTLAVTLSACVGPGKFKPVIESRYAALEGTRAAPVGAVRITVSTSDTGMPPPAIPFETLSESAQAALITATNGRPPLELTAPGSSPASVPQSLMEVSRHLDLAIRPTEFLAPGDRVDAIRVSLEVGAESSRSWRLTNWTQATNGEKVIQLGTVTHQSSNTLTASTGVRIQRDLPGATLSDQASRSTVQEASLNDATDFSAGVDPQGRAWLDETSGWRDTSAHNFSIDVTLSALPGQRTRKRYVAVSGMVGAQGSAGLPAGVRLVESFYDEPSESDRPICGTASLTYRVRHILAGQETYTEADDRIVFLSGTDELRFVLAPAPRRLFYQITAGSEPLSYRQPIGRPKELLFSSLDQATQFLSWFRASGNPVTLANAELGVATASTWRSLTGDELAALAPAPNSDGAQSLPDTSTRDAC